MQRKQVLLDYVVSHARGDQRPYLRVSVLGVPLLGLLDSGASCTIVGKPGWEILRQLGLELNTSETVPCSLANGSTCSSIGHVQVPICLMDRIRIIKVLVVPDLAHTLILGMDFWLSMDLIPDLKRDTWQFANEPDVINLASIKSSEELSPEQKRALDQLIDEKFTAMGDKLGSTTATEHEIITDSRPIKQRYYPVSPAKQRIIDEEIKNMLAQGIIEPSKSAWSSPILLVPKKDGSYRFCVDYRRLNAVTKKDAYPLPYISAILDQLRNAHFLSSIDIKSAYWQVPVAESSREYTAFTIPGGLYQFKKMPFGLSNSPATFQRLIDNVLGADMQPFVFVYLDDIIIISPDFESHLESLTKVFDRLISAGLTVNREKCQFCLPQLKYLGYVVDRLGLRVDPEKVEAILNIPSPSNVSEVRRFIGMTSWYRRFVKDFSTLVSPLTQLTKKNIRWNWTNECEHSFQTLKERLVSAPILNCPDFDRPFVLQTDASGFGLGAVLTQTFDDGEKVICFLSRSLTRQERNYSPTERECLAVIWSIEKLRHYLEGIHFTVITDHYSLLWLHRLKDPTGRLARWAVRLQPYSFDIIHRKGKDHVVPDFLSRSVQPESVDVIEPNNLVPNFATTSDNWYLRMLQDVDQHPDKYPLWRVENSALFKYMKSPLPELSSEADDWKLVIPKDARRELLQKFHDDATSGHVGMYKTYWKLRVRYYWPGMKSDVSKYITSCKVCGEQKPEQKAPAGLMGLRPIATQPWQTISLDFIGPLPRSTSGYTHILVIVDSFTKFVVLIPLRSASAKLLAKHVEEGIFLLYGVPQTIICDNGVQMRSNEFKNLCQKYNVKISYTPLYYPRADPAERVNKIVKTMLSSFVKSNHRKWDVYLQSVACAIRSSRHEVTGYSPYFANFGREKVNSGHYYDHILQREPPQEDEFPKRLLGYRKMYEDIRQRLQNAQLRNQHRYNLRRRPVHFDVGQFVWRKNKVLSDATHHFTAKFAPTFVGPFRIRRKVGLWTYQLEDDDGNERGVWHVQDLKPAPDGLDD